MLTLALLSDLADCSKALELTRGLGEIELPLCAEYERRTALDKWLTKAGFRDLSHWSTHKTTQKLRARLTKNISSTPCISCVAMAAMSENLEQQREDWIDEDWDIPLVQLPTLASEHQQAKPLHHVPRPHKDRDGDVPENFQLQGHLFRGAGVGPTVFLWDAWKSQIWDLFTHAGFFTYPHHDASGFATYAFIRHGCKIWGILRPRVNPQQHQSRNQLFDILRTMLRPAPSLEYQHVSDIFNVFLLEGDVLVQPPNAVHQVYTPVNTVASGGHLFTYETLHLTELARDFDCGYNHTSTNADHASAHRTICRMAIALKEGYKGRSK